MANQVQEQDRPACNASPCDGCRDEDVWCPCTCHEADGRNPMPDHGATWDAMHEDYRRRFEGGS